MNVATVTPLYGKQGKSIAKKVEVEKDLSRNFLVFALPTRSAIM